VTKAAQKATKKWWEADLGTINEDIELKFKKTTLNNTNNKISVCQNVRPQQIMYWTIWLLRSKIHRKEIRRKKGLML
jgi:hypothetical protein